MDLKKLESKVKKEEAELEEAKKALQVAQAQESKKEERREVERQIKTLDLRAAMSELDLFKNRPNPAFVEKEILEIGTLEELKKYQDAAERFLAREKAKEEERLAKRKAAEEKLAALGLTVEDLKELGL